MNVSTDRLRAALEGSRVVTTLDQATRSARIVEGTHRTITQARTVAMAESLADAVESWARASRIGRTTIALTDRLERYVDRSLARSTVEIGIDCVEASWIYRWLTAEPDPDVIVIDLRDTLSVGAWIALLDRTLDHLLPWGSYSLLVRSGDRAIDITRGAPIRIASVLVIGATAASFAVVPLVGEITLVGFLTRVAVLVAAVVGTQIRTSWAELSETLPVRLLIAVLEPPEPPESTEVSDGYTAGEDPPGSSRDDDRERKVEEGEGNDGEEEDARDGSDAGNEDA